VKLQKTWSPEDVYLAIEAGLAKTIPAGAFTEENLLTPVRRERESKNRGLKSKDKFYHTNYIALDLLCAKNALSSLPPRVRKLLTLENIAEFSGGFEALKTLDDWEQVSEIKELLDKALMGEYPNRKPMTRQDKELFVEALTACFEPDLRHLRIQIEEPSMFIDNYKEWNKVQRIRHRENDKPAIYGGLRFVDPKVNVIIKKVAQCFLSTSGLKGLRVYLMKLNSQEYSCFNPGNVPRGSYFSPDTVFVDRVEAESDSVALRDGTLLLADTPDDPKEKASYFAATISLDILGTIAHEFGHAAVDKTLKKALSPAEYKAFLTSVLEMDVRFRKKVISSFSYVFSVDYPYVDYLAGETHAISKGYGDYGVQEYAAGEFLAEMSSLVFLKELDPGDIPESCQDVTQHIVRQIEAGVAKFEQIMRRPLLQESPNAKKVQEVLQVLNWMITEKCDPAQKPDWLTRKVPEINPDRQPAGQPPPMANLDL
jgi:hypothetical protein